MFYVWFSMMNNKKGEVTRPMMILFIIVFYSVLSVIYSVYGSSITSYTENIITTEEEIIAEEYDETEKSKSGFISFVKNIGIAFKQTPLWLNIIFFIPLSVFFGYLLIVAWVYPS